MKNLFITTLATILLISCEDVYHIELNKHYIEVDYQAQEIILKTDENIGSAIYDLAHSDTELGEEFVIGNITHCKGGWFTIMLDRSKPRQVTISVEENQIGKDRKITLYVKNGYGGDDSATIVQKAKPTE